MSDAASDRRRAALAGMREEFSCVLGAERRLRGREQQHKDPDGLTTAHVRALFALGAREEATAGQIAEAARLTPGQRHRHARRPRAGRHRHPRSAPPTTDAASSSP